MLIQAAIKLAEDLDLSSRRKQEVGPVIGVLNLGKQGYEGFTKLGSTTEKGKYLRAQMWMPQRNGRTGNPDAEFIVDKAGFLLGLDGEDQMASYIETVSDAALETGDEGLKALLSFLTSSDLEKACNDYEQMFDVDGNLLVSFDGTYVHERPAVVEYWLKQDSECLPKEAMCSFCGKMRKPVRLHPKISGGGLRGSLISFNSKVTDSYGHSGAENFPVCPDCAGAYSLALQRLLKEDFPSPKTGEPMPRSSLRLSDTTVAVYWGDKEYIDLRDIFENGVVTALPDKGDDSHFHVAILSQLSTGRLTVEHYRDDDIAKILGNWRQFYQQLEVEFNPEFVKRPYTPDWYNWALVVDKTGKKKTGKKVPPSFVSDLFECAINPDIKFSSWMYNRALNQAMRHRKVTPALASIIKAVLIRNYKDNEMTSALNPEHSEVAYQFGRLFAVVEHLHSRSIKSNQTLADTLLVSAATRPNTVRLKLERKFILCAKKLRMDNQGKIAGWYSKQVGEITERISGLPSLFNPEQQGLFLEGYHQQTNDLWKPKAEIPVEPQALAATA